MFYPGFNAQWWASTIASGVATWTTGTNAPVMAGVTGYRVVTAGIILRSVVAPLSASGMVRVRTFNSPSASSLAALDYSSYNCNEYSEMPLHECKEVCVASTRTNDVQARTLQVPYVADAIFTNQPNNGFSYIVVAVDGGPASAASVLNVEILVNYELSFADDSASSLLALPSKPADPVLVQAATLVSSEVKAIATNGIVSFGKAVATSAVNALSSALTARMGMIGLAPRLVD